MTLPDLLLLHGALGSSAQLLPLAAALRGHYTPHLLDFEGHGAAPMRGRPMRIEHFSENVLEYLRERGIGPTPIFGFSMGGYVACTLARLHPDLVTRVATLGTRFHWDPAAAERECALLDPAKIEAKVPHFAHALAERHPAGWQEVLFSTQEFLRHMGSTGGLSSQEAAATGVPVRVMVGDRDSTVPVEQAVEVFRALPAGELEVLPGTRHELERVPLERLAASLLEFFGRD